MATLYLSILSSPIWLYVSHLMTWCSLLFLGILFRRRLGRMFQYVTAQTSIAETDLERDRLVGGAVEGVEQVERLRAGPPRAPQLA